MATHELVVPKSIPITSPASSDLNRRAIDESNNELVTALFFHDGADRLNSIDEANIVYELFLWLLLVDVWW